MAWSVDESRMLAEETLSELPQRLAHVRGVVAAALEIGAPDGVVSAAWLHDVGYADRLHGTGMHAIDGALFLDLLGAPQEVVSLVAFHTGAEFEADERGLIDQLIQFDRPRQEPLDLLILADLVTSPSGARLEVGERLSEILLRYEPQHPVHRSVTRAHTYLWESAERAALRVGYPINAAPPSIP